MKLSNLSWEGIDKSEQILVKMQNGITILLPFAYILFKKWKRITNVRVLSSAILSPSAL